MYVRVFVLTHSLTAHLELKVFQDGVDVDVAVEARGRHAVAVRAEADAADGPNRVREGVHHAERLLHACQENKLINCVCMRLYINFVDVYI